MAETIADFKMPEKVVFRLVKDALPDNVVISNDAKNVACHSACIFILQLTSVAAEKAEESGRTTIENQDIIKAICELGLGEYAPQLVRFGAQRKRNAKRKESTMLKHRYNKKAPSSAQVEQHETGDSFGEMDHDFQEHKGTPISQDDSMSSDDAEPLSQSPMRDQNFD